jgi:hypothetical protein
MKFKSLMIILLAACMMQTVSVKAVDFKAGNKIIQLPPPPRRPPPHPPLHIKNPFRHRHHSRRAHHGITIHLPPHPKGPPPPPRP